MFDKAVEVEYKGEPNKDDIKYKEKKTLGLVIMQMLKLPRNEINQSDEATAKQMLEYMNIDGDDERVNNLVKNVAEKLKEAWDESQLLTIENKNFGRKVLTQRYVEKIWEAIEKYKSKIKKPKIKVIVDEDYDV